MSLFTNLNMAARAMDAQRFGLEVTGNNLANLNTPGYARRRAVLVEAPVALTGVNIAGVRAVRDALLDSRLRRELPAEGREAAVADQLAAVEVSLGTAGASLDARLTAYFDAFAALAADPTSPNARQSVVMQGQQLATAFSDMSSRFDTARRSADAKIQGGLDEINTLTAELADINAAIAAGQGDNAALQDRQATVLDSLSGIANVNLIRRDDGGVDVALANGEALVLGPEAYRLAPVPAGPDGLSSVQLNGVDVTASITGGRLGGLLQVRDTIVPGYQTRLDELAYAVVTEVNTRHQAGFTAAGAPAGVFFTPLGGVADAAEFMAVDPALAADPSLVAASGTGAPGDNGAATALANLRTTGVLNGGTTSMLDAWSQLVYTVGADSQMARLQQGTRQSIVEQVTRLRDSVEGVSLDEEAAMLIKYQRAYEANAQFFSVVDQTLQTLLNLVGGR